MGVFPCRVSCQQMCNMQAIFLERNRALLVENTPYWPQVCRYSPCPNASAYLTRASWTTRTRLKFIIMSYHRGYIQLGRKMWYWRPSLPEIRGCRGASVRTIPLRQRCIQCYYPHQLSSELEYDVKTDDDDDFRKKWKWANPQQCIIDMHNSSTAGTHQHIISSAPNHSWILHMLPMIMMIEDEDSFVTSISWA